MRSNKSLISLIIPAYNESSNLEWHHKKISEFAKSKELNLEIIYINDGSTDNSLEILKKITKQDKSTQYLSLSRNFGKEAAGTAGLKQSSGDAVVMIDADGQHPIEILPTFIEEWVKGFDVVIGVRKDNQKEGLVQRYGSKLYNILMRSLTGRSSVAGATDFRLIDRKVINEFNKLTERNRITRGLIDWLGFKRTYVDFKSPARHSGEATYSFKKRLKLALHSFTSQSTKPLQFTGFLGAVVTIVSVAAALFLLIEKYVFNDPLKLAVTGTAILALFLSFLVGLVLICQWLLALYIENIHSETQNRPLYIIAEKSK